MTLRMTTVSLCLFLITVTAQSADVPDPIDGYEEAVELVGTHDPLCIVLKLSDDAIIDTAYDDSGGKVHGVIWKWEKEQKETGKPKRLQLTYTNKDGVQIREPESGVAFSLVGTIDDHHPIDRAMGRNGSIWSDVCSQRMVQVVRNQARLWQAVKEW